MSRLTFKRIYTVTYSNPSSAVGSNAMMDIAAHSLDGVIAAFREHHASNSSVRITGIVEQLKGVYV